VGALAGSWQHAIHATGAYCILQDLWVSPIWRGQRIGTALLTALFERMRERGLARVEVGLPAGHFGGLGATEAFYLRHGFRVLGPRMRQVLA
jgi:GNAT superfamily N-acetyltransferase